MSEKPAVKTSAAEYAALNFYHRISYLRSDTWIKLHRLSPEHESERSNNALSLHRQDNFYIGKIAAE